MPHPLKSFWSIPGVHLHTYLFCSVINPQQLCCNKREFKYGNFITCFGLRTVLFHYFNYFRSPLMKPMLQAAVMGEARYIQAMTSHYKNRDALIKRYIYGCTIWLNTESGTDERLIGLRIQYGAMNELGWSQEMQREMFGSICQVEFERKASVKKQARKLSCLLRKRA